MKDLIVTSDIDIRKAMKAMVSSSVKCLLVVNKNKNLIGTLSDGDLRRAILSGMQVNDLIERIYNQKPTYFVQSEYNLDDVKKMFLENKFDLIPVVDNEHKVVDVLVWEEVFKDNIDVIKKKLDVPVVIMAGGKGTRMEPFTKVLPKPLVPINEKPIIEHIIERFTSHGITDFRITINYKSKIMRAYFEEIAPDYSVVFIQEKKPLGTAGSLKFLVEKLDQPFFVTNCDIIVNADYLNIYQFHQDNNFDITLVASMKNYIIPYGTCKLNGDGHLQNINEKPEYDFLVNTGLYVLNPDVLNFIPKGKSYHITQLIKDVKEDGKRVGVYPIDDDSWIDVGQWSEYQNAVEKL